jgi:hypothetical protein
MSSLEQVFQTTLRWVSLDAMAGLDRR